MTWFLWPNAKEIRKTWGVLAKNTTLEALLCSLHPRSIKERAKDDYESPLESYYWSSALDFWLALLQAFLLSSQMIFSWSFAMFVSIIHDTKCIQVEILMHSNMPSHHKRTLFSPPLQASSSLGCSLFASGCFSSFEKCVFAWWTFPTAWHNEFRPYFLWCRVAAGGSTLFFSGIWHSYA